ncbi:MAG: winged helix-turn-helix transcriptional regulator [Nanoarchaeota archaeon]|nr:winged helix-turn-helix transcriptional regulator [Nanoarchaeota archaeon]
MIKSKSLQNAYDRFLTTLSNKVRLTIIYSLKDNPKNVTRLTNELKIHQTTVSHSLRRLLDCGFVFVEQNGKERIYSVNKKTIKPLLKLMEEHVNNYCAKGVCK